MKKLLFLPLFMTLTASCSGGNDFTASDDVQTHVRNTLTDVTGRVEVEVQSDNIYIFVENTDGLSIEKRYRLPKPNVFDGRYKIEYACEESCLVTYDERAAEVLSDSIVKALFDKHVKDAVDTLERKSKMANNT